MKTYMYISKKKNNNNCYWRCSSLEAKKKKYKLTEKTNINNMLLLL